MEGGAGIGEIVLVENDSGPEPLMQTDRRRRRAKLVRTGLRAGRRTLGAKVRGAFAGQERRAQIQQDAMIHSAREAAETLGHMKGIVMKMGQMASFVAQALPEEIRGPLQSLQQDAPPMTWELAREMLESELQAPVERVFDDIEPLPAAAASIGQVHRALLADGTKVAVKVQYPGVDAAIRADLENAGLLKVLLGRLAPGFDLDPFVEEFRARVTEELDYRIEARNQEAFADAWRGDAVVRIPQVFPELSTQRVLVSEWQEGARFEDIWDRPAEERNAIGCALFWYAQRCVGSLGMFNGDPHPGNYVFRDDGGIVFLDFGCVKRLDPTLLSTQRAMIDAMRERDPDAVLRTLVESGQMDATAPVVATDVMEFLEPFYAAILDDVEYAFTPESRLELMNRLLARDHHLAETRDRIRLPAEMFFLMRLNAGLGAILARLGTTANFFRLHDAAWNRNPGDTRA